LRRQASETARLDGRWVASNPNESAAGKSTLAGFPDFRSKQQRSAAQVRFVAWTAKGHLRHAAFLGLRMDKRATEVRREV
jgi:ATP-dependent DNA ligase